MRLLVARREEGVKALLEVELLDAGTVGQAEAGEVREVRERPGGEERLV